MKPIPLLLAVSLATPVWAIDQDSSWPQIHKSPYYNVDDAQINFAGTMVSVFNVCMLDKDTLRTIKAIPVYEWSEGVSDDLNPVLKGKDFLYRSLAQLKPLSDYDGTTDVLESAAISYSVDVFNNLQYQHSAIQPVFTKNYTISDC